MRITFENMQDNKVLDPHGNMMKENISHDAGRTSRARQIEKRNTEPKPEKMAGYLVDIGNQGNKTRTGGTYKKEEVAKMSLEDISAMASGMDMNVQKKYMAVMSNSMSAEEFGEMVKGGYDVSDVDIETVVTILDHIKVAVAKGGGEIAGFTDTISSETLEQILGSGAYAEALEGGLDEASISYMVENQMEPTPENIYKAKYSAGGAAGQESRKNEGTWMPDKGMPETAEGSASAYPYSEAFQEQVDKVISEAGLEINEESRQDASFLLQHDIPLTEENLKLYERIKPFEKGQEGLSEEELKARIIMQTYEGKEPWQADLSKEESIYKQAVDLFERVQEMTPASYNRNYQLPQDMDMLTARRQLEEVRLRMTVEANLKLLRSGFEIDTAPIEQMIKQLREAEEALEGLGVLQAEEVTEQLSELQFMPVTALSYAVNREISFTVADLHEKGGSLQADYERADQRYETMQTMPRADMGDSIQKAFRNVDDILTDMNKEASEENRRAIRILGYNQLELTEENFTRAHEMDQKVQNLFQDMKPGKVLQMIRDGVDVLHTDIEELDAYLTEQKGGFLAESEDFAKFLQKLDRSGDITPEERVNYVGIYRLIRQVEKADGKAEGYLLGSEAQVTLENLLAAVRSSKKGYIDYKVDESFSGVDAIQKGKNILDQITASADLETTEYEEMKETLKEFSQGKQPGVGDAVEFLEEMKQPVTVSNLIAASSVLQEEAEIYQKIEDYEKTEKQEELLEAEQTRLEGYIEQLQDSVTDETSLQEGMEAFARQTEVLLRETEEKDGITELDIRDLQRIYKGIRFRTALSKESRYQIPVKLEAGYAVMNLTVRQGTQESRAEISIKTESYGRLEAIFVAEKDGIAGTFFSERKDGVSLLKRIAEKAEENLSASGVKTEGIQVIQGSLVRHPAYERTMAEREGKEVAQTGDLEISTKELYQIAKIFLETVRNEC